MDKQPVASGRFILTLKPEGVLLAEDFDPAVHPPRNRYQSHFSSCPNAGLHRRPK